MGFGISRDRRISLSPCSNTLLYSTNLWGALCRGSLRIVRGAFEFLNPAPLEKARHPYSEFQAKVVDFFADGLWLLLGF